LGTLARYALSIGAVAAFAGCGGSQLSTTPDAIPRSSAIGPALAYKVLYKLEPADGERPQTGLISVKGEFYGTTFSGGYGNCSGSDGCGTVFKLSKNGSYAVLHRFGYGGGRSDGMNPGSALIDVKGTLYGTTEGGGKFGDGTVYSISTTGSEHVLHTFRGGSDGANPAAALIDVNGTLYGTTQRGGLAGRCKGYTDALGCGTVYSITTSGTEKVLHRFGAGSDGAFPLAPLTYVNGTLYGTTYYGGGTGCYYSLGCGIIFAIDVKGSLKVLYSFKGGTDGSYPLGNLVDVRGDLYGTTAFGARSGCVDGCGSVYRVTLSGSEKVLHRFGKGSDGSRPYAGLIELNGMLYGTTTSGGGPGEDGTIYSITPSGSEKVIYKLSGYEGRDPEAPLLELGGRFYSTTVGGGNGSGEGYGTVFVLTP